MLSNYDIHNSLFLEKVSWIRAWDEYVRGNVVSHHAALLIRRFLLDAMACSGKAADDAQSEADASADEEELPPLKVSCQRFQPLLQSSQESGSLGGKLAAAALQVKLGRST